MEQIKPLTSSDWEKLVNQYTHFISEVRKRILLTLLVFAIASISGFVFYEQIIRFLIQTLSLEGVNIVFTSPFQFINLAVGCGVACGLTLTLPLIIAQILSFLRPALKIKEFKALVNLLLFSIMLFIAGFAFGGWVMKWQIEIFLARSISLGIGNILDVSKLLNTVLLTAVFMGVSFQIPIVLYLLVKVGLIKEEMLRKSRAWIYLGSFFFVILLPMDSILADVLCALPLLVLFETVLILTRISNHRRSKLVAIA